MAERIKFSVKKNNTFYLNDSDREVLLFLYMPIIGSKAYIIYNLFYSLTGATGSFLGDPLLLIDFLSDLNVTDKELNDALKILRDFKLLKIESKTEFVLYRPMSKEKFRESVAYEELLDNISSIEKKIIMDKFGFTKQVLDYKHLEYVRDKKVRDFDVETFKSYTTEAGYNILDSDLIRIEAMAKTYSLSFDECLRLFYESNVEDGKYDVDQMVEKSIDVYFNKKEKERRKNITKAQNDETHITYFEQQTPLELLQDNLKGVVVPEQDQHLIQEMRNKLCLSDPMINILLGYSIATNHGKIQPFAFYERIVLDWKKHKIKTVEDAYYYINELYNGKTNKGTKKGKQSSAEEWFKNYWDSYLKEKEGNK